MDAVTYVVSLTVRKGPGKQVTWSSAFDSPEGRKGLRWTLAHLTFLAMKELGVREWGDVPWSVFSWECIAVDRTTLRAVK